jgi:two-component system response regulator YesN
MSRIWKVLIADDEPIIREGIHMAVDWTLMSMEVVAEAEDGEEALELAEQHQVDIMLVDLNMPIMDGITMMKHIRNVLPHCRLIIITGHDEFQYAQEAIRLDVDEYILKPANPLQLRKVLEEVGNSLDAEYREREHLVLASQQIKRNYPLLRERFCLEWIEGNTSVTEIIEQLEFLQLPTACPQWIGTIRWSDSALERTLPKEKDRQLYLFAIENIVGEWLAEWKHVMFRDPAGLIAVIVWGDMNQSVFNEITKSIAQWLKLSVTQAFLPVLGGFEAIPDMYRQVKLEVYKDARLSPLIRRARLYIYEHYMIRGLTLEQVSGSLNANPIHLSRTLKNELGVTFSQLLTDIRMKKAVELLSSTDMSILHISEQLGYDTQHYFSTVFKKAIGVSPNQYRRGEHV